MTLHPIVLLVVSYLVGSISPAYLFARAMRGIDLRETGNRNLGARNAARTLGRPVGVAVWLLDMAKGAAAVGLAQVFGHGTLVAIACGAAAVIGHNWPIYYGFRGGRGASTAMGAVFVLLPLEMAIGLALWVLISLVSGSLYLGGLIAHPAMVGLALAFGKTGVLAFSPLLVAIPLMLRHIPALIDMTRKRALRLP
jgi:glycerol-3-phosphate acyltransferase PlsY